MNTFIINSLQCFGLVNIIYGNLKEIGNEPPYRLYSCPCGENGTIVCRYCQFQCYCSKDHGREDCVTRHKIICPFMRNLLSLNCSECNESTLLYNNYVYGAIDDVPVSNTLNLSGMSGELWKRMLCRKCFVLKKPIHFFKAKVSQSIAFRVYSHFSAKIIGLLQRNYNIENYLSPLLICFSCKKIMFAVIPCEYCKKFNYCSISCKKVHFNEHKHICLLERFKTVNCGNCKKIIAIGDISSVSANFYIDVKGKKQHVNCVCYTCYKNLLLM
jgi:hypothetical protein